MERKELGPNQPIITPKRLKLLEMMEKGKVDRISAVPDCLLLEILSRLPSTKDAIRTGTLSKRWKHLWTLVPTLIFKHDDRNLPWSNFASFVDKTLTQCRQLKLKKFKLYIRCHSRALCQVNTWIHDVIRYNVEELNLNLKGWDIEDEFWLDQYLIINTCLTDLTLEGGIFNALGAISWKKLKRLCISHAFIDGALIENISSGSPLLETLDLNDCSGFRRLDITSKSVKNLVLDDNIGWALDFVEIKAPNILSLTIKGRMYLEKLSLVNLSSLVEANLNYYHTNDKMPKEAEEEMLKGLILNLRHVKIFKIGSSCSKVLLRLEAKGFVIPSNVKIADGFYK